MTHEEAYQKALNVRWKVTTCDSGEECWCRLIVPEEPILYGDNNVEEVTIVSYASLNKICAEQIVSEHNNSLVSEILRDKKRDGWDNIFEEIEGPLNSELPERVKNWLRNKFYSPTFK